MPHGVLKNWHPMIGCDFHDLMPPGSPTVTGKAPHYCGMILMGTGATAQWGPSEGSHWGWTMQRGTDIGPLIPHLGPPNCLLPVIIVLSSSKSHFGTQQFHVKGKPAAVALAFFVNLNLNCNGPIKIPPVPSGGVLAFTTHVADMTLGDIIAGFAHMAFDSLLQFAIARFFNLGPFERFSQRVYERFLFGPVFNRFLPALGSGRVISWAYRRNMEEMIAKGVLNPLATNVIASLLGSPMGLAAPVNAYDALNDIPASEGDERTATDRAHDAIRDFVDGPGVETHDVPEPAGPDAGVLDAGPTDAGPPDAGAPDAGPPDAGPPDAGAPDAGAPDAGPPDAGPPDAGPPADPPSDGGASGMDGGSSDAGTPNSTPAEPNMSVPPDDDGGVCLPEDD